MFLVNRRARNPGMCISRSLSSTFVIISSTERLGSVKRSAALLFHDCRCAAPQLLARLSPIQFMIH
jgi:hypothetical protein